MRTCVLMLALAMFARASDPDAKAKRDRDADAALNLLLLTKPAEKSTPSKAPEVIVGYCVDGKCFVLDRLSPDVTDKDALAAVEKAREAAKHPLKTTTARAAWPGEEVEVEDLTDVGEFLIYADTPLVFTDVPPKPVAKAAVPMVCENGVCRPLVATVKAVTPFRSADCACTNCTCATTSAAPLTYAGDGGRPRLFQGRVRGFFGRLFGR